MWCSQLSSRFRIPRLLKSCSTFQHLVSPEIKLLFFRKIVTSKCESLTKSVKIQNFLNNMIPRVNGNPDGETNGIPNGQFLKMFVRRETLKSNLCSLEEMKSDNNSKDEELKKLIQEEKKIYLEQLMELEYELLESCCPKDNVFDGVILEITSGVGGQEAMLFAKDMYNMYCGYFTYNGWNFLIEVLEKSVIGGLRHASILIEGNESFKKLKFESGVHRVQRIPLTEKSGRIHTSTVTVAILPQPKEVDIYIHDKDLVIDTMRACGAGGQHVNTTDSAVRITHIPTGLVVECQTERSQLKNREIGMRKLRSKLYQKEVEKQVLEINKMRQSQVGCSARSDKVRTYNFNKDRITDHRLSKTFHNVTEFLKGRHLLDNVINDLILVTERENVDNFISSIIHDNKQ